MINTLYHTFWEIQEERCDYMQAIEQTLESREVAEMVDKEHRQILKDIRRYTEQFNEGKISPLISSRKVLMLTLKAKPDLAIA